MSVVQPIRGEKGAGLDADLPGTEHRAIVDTTGTRGVSGSI
jgi:hypothetical protein